MSIKIADIIVAFNWGGQRDEELVYIRIDNFANDIPRRHFHTRHYCLCDNKYGEYLICRNYREDELDFLENLLGIVRRIRKAILENKSKKS